MVSFGYIIVLTGHITDKFTVKFTCTKNMIQISSISHRKKSEIIVVCYQPKDDQLFTVDI